MTTMRTTTAGRRAGAAGTSVARDELATRVRPDFPILEREVNGKPLVYLDSAASSQKPVQVLAAMQEYYTRHNANVHRGVHTLAEEATRLFEEARGKVARFAGASERATVFTKNATEAINLVAWGWGLRNLREGDELLVTEMEHHANLVPWQLVARLTGARLAAIPVTDAYTLDLDALDRLLTERTRLVAVSAMSNVLGTVNPVAEVAAKAHAAGALVLADASQAVPHVGVTLDGLGADFLAFTGHKMLGPMGVGVLAAREELLDGMEPFLGGGEMIRDVTIQSSTWNDIPWRFEAGTPNVAEAIGLGAAVDYLGGLGMDAVRAHEHAVTAYALERLAEVDGLRVLGPPATEQRGGAVSFTLGDVHPHDVAQVLDADGIAVRAGHHCAKPLMSRFGLAATTRASFYVYSTSGEVDALVGTLDKVRRLFA
ncbi:MAG TPA: SufS family cysteine desulfurase [Actinomycetota bacterium]|jgi:cysteine desulfurase / selenocysteine lyase